LQSKAQDRAWGRAKLHERLEELLSLLTEWEKVADGLPSQPDPWPTPLRDRLDALHMITRDDELLNSIFDIELVSDQLRRHFDRYTGFEIADAQLQLRECIYKARRAIRHALK
jgi:hypothetical protein